MKLHCNAYVATLCQLLVALLLLWLTRFAFYFYNADVIGEITAGRLLVLALKGTAFDISVLAYANALFILMRFLPFDFTLRRGWRIAEMTVYALANAALLIINIGDIAYFRFNGGRLRMDSFIGLLNGETIKVAFSFVGQYAWAVVAMIAFIVLLVWLATRFKPQTIAGRRPMRWIMLLLAVLLTFLSMRFCIVGRPLSLHRAADMADRPAEINVILNSPFAIMRSTSRTNPMQNLTFFTDAELSRLRNSLQNPAAPLDADTLKSAVTGKNIVLIVMEGGAQLWFDNLTMLRDDPARNLMPFLDSIASESMVMTNNICTSDRSQLGLAAILGGIPTVSVMDWAAASYAGLDIDAAPKLLGNMGYETRFYIGTKPIILHLGALARQMGFNEIIGIDDVDIPLDHETTNQWGIYDHVMGRHVAETLTDMPAPFFACWMTLDLHGPYELPDDWKSDTYPATASDLERCVEYTDYAMREFFDRARRQPWFNNTLFVITADHGCRDFSSGKLNTPYIYSHIPLIFYTPDDSIKPARLPQPTMSQFDTPAALLWLAGYDKPYVNMGTNPFDPAKPHYGLLMRNEMLNVFSDNLAIQATLDGQRIVNVFDLTTDPAMQSPLTVPYPAETDNMLRWLRALLQDYTTRANTARLAGN